MTDGASDLHFFSGRPESMLPVDLSHGIADIWLFRPFPGLLAMGFICKHGLVSSYLFVLREACPSFVFAGCIGLRRPLLCLRDDAVGPQSAVAVAAVVRLEGLQVAFCQSAACRPPRLSHRGSATFIPYATW